MKILFVHPATEMTIGDVARGYRAALERQGHDIADYYLNKRLAYHQKAIPPEVGPEVISVMASETVAVEAMRFSPDLVIIISGLNFHPIGLWLLGKLNIPVVTIFTESPYDDIQQSEWANLRHVGSNLDMTIFTNDRYSAIEYGWGFLPPAFDPAIHYRAEPDSDGACDVIMVGSGWPERQALLEAVNWNGIDLKLYGIWPGLENNPDSPLSKFYHPAIVVNAHIAGMYRAAKICINVNRKSATALTPGPRVFEIAGCGAFQISDPRPDMAGVFGHCIPTFLSPQELEEKIRFYLGQPQLRQDLADEAYDRVRSETFDNRAAGLIAAIRKTALAQQGV